MLWQWQENVLSRVQGIPPLLEASINKYSLNLMFSRTEFINISELILGGVRMMDVTATATKKSSLKSRLHWLQGPKSSNLSFTRILEAAFAPIATYKLERSLECPRAILFCRTVKACTQLYMYFKRALREQLTYHIGAPQVALQTCSAVALTLK